MSDVFLWTLTRGRASVGLLARIYSHQIWMDTGCRRIAGRDERLGRMEGEDQRNLSCLLDLTMTIKILNQKAAVVSILLYGCTTWMLNKRMEKKFDGNYTRMLREILNKSWRQHPTKQQLYDYLPLITKTIQVRRTRHAGHCWRSRDELISDILLGPLHMDEQRTYIQ